MDVQEKLKTSDPELFLIFHAMSLSVRLSVLKHFGHWGSAAESFLSELAKKSRDLEGNTNYAEFKNTWKKRISIAFQRCHGRVVLKKVSRLSHGKNTPDGLFACDIHSHVL